MKKLLAALALSLCASASNAAIHAYTWEENGNVLSSWSGTLDVSNLAGPALVGTFTDRALIEGDRTYFFNVQATYVFYSGLVPNFTRLAPANTTGQVLGTRTGDSLGYLTDAGYLYLAPGYVSGTQLSGTQTLTGVTLADLGITAPVTLTLDDSTGQNLITHTYGAMAPVPVPAALPLALTGFGILAFARRRRQKA